MVSALVVGLNSYVTLDEANAYLEDKLTGAVAWDALDDEVRVRALISAFRILEKQEWPGDQTGFDVAATVDVNTGGTSYAVGDLLTVVGGTFEAPAIAKVTAATAGVVTAVELVDAGLYDDGLTPSSPVATTGGAGTGATLTMTFQDQVATFPATGVVDCDGTAVDSTGYPQKLKDAQIEYAFALTQNPGLESSAGIGSNVRSVGAGSARVEFFRSTGGANGTGSQRFPTEVWELIRCMLIGGPSAISAGGIVSGTDGESEFLDYPDKYQFTEGI